MTRMRGVKPDLLRHEGLLDLEESTGLPMRLAFIGLIMCADRCGRFQWRPRTLKAECLPHDTFDFSVALDALERGGFVLKYEAEGKAYGWIPGFTVHQRLNPREQKSTIPPHPDEQLQCNYTAIANSGEDNCGDASEQTHLPENVITRGKERKGRGKEEEGERKDPPCELASLPPVSEEEAWQYAKNLPVAPAWTKAMVAQWWADRDFRGWETASGTPITGNNWRKDLRNCHTWAQRALPREGQPGASGTFPTPKKISAPIPHIDEPPHVSGLLALVRQRKPDFTGTWQDVPASLRRVVEEEWNESLAETLTPA